MFWTERINTLRSRMLLAFALSALVSACAIVPLDPIKVYLGPDLPESEISIIQPISRYAHGFWASRHDTTYVNVTHVDRVPRTSKDDPNGPFHVRPGQHQVRAVIHRGEGSSGLYWNLVPDIDRTIIFPTEAGKKYLIRARRINDVSCCPFSAKLLDVWVWVVDLNTGEVIAGETPPIE
jgi:hypothetical protein